MAKVRDYERMRYILSCIVCTQQTMHFTHKQCIQDMQPQRFCVFIDTFLFTNGTKLVLVTNLVGQGLSFDYQILNQVCLNVVFSQMEYQR